MATTCAELLQQAATQALQSNRPAEALEAAIFTLLRDPSGPCYDGGSCSGLSRSAVLAGIVVPSVVAFLALSLLLALFSARRGYAQPSSRTHDIDTVAYKDQAKAGALQVTDANGAAGGDGGPQPQSTGLVGQINALFRWGSHKDSASRGLSKIRSFKGRASIEMAPPAGPDTTLLLSDVQNSTSLWELLPTEVMDECMRLHDDCFRSFLTKHQGYESATEGDAFILAFWNPASALRFAMDVQAALLSAPWPGQLLIYPDARPTHILMRTPDQTNSEAGNKLQAGGLNTSGGEAVPSPGLVEKGRNRMLLRATRSFRNLVPKAAAANMQDGDASPRPSGEQDAIDPDLDDMIEADTQDSKDGGSGDATLWGQRLGACLPRVRGTAANKDKVVKIFGGFRVRMGIHTGVESRSDVSYDAASGRTVYSGAAMDIARAVADAGPGGGVLLSSDAFARLPHALIDSAHLIDRMVNNPKFSIASAGDNRRGSMSLSLDLRTPPLLNPTRTNENEPTMLDAPITTLVVYAGDYALSKLKGTQAGATPMALYLAVPSQLPGRLPWLAPPRNVEKHALGTLSAPVGNVTIAFLYVCGASALLTDQPAEARKALARLQYICIAELTRASGYPVEVADGLILAAFPHPVMAVSWALRCQEMLQAQAWSESIVAHDACTVAEGQQAPWAHPAPCNLQPPAMVATHEPMQTQTGMHDGLPVSVSSQPGLPGSIRTQAVAATPHNTQTAALKAHDSVGASFSHLSVATSIASQETHPSQCMTTQELLNICNESVDAGARVANAGGSQVSRARGAGTGPPPVPPPAAPHAPAPAPPPPPPPPSSPWSLSVRPAGPSSLDSHTHPRDPNTVPAVSPRHVAAFYSHIPVSGDMSSSERMSAGALAFQYSRQLTAESVGAQGDESAGASLRSVVARTKSGHVTVDMGGSRNRQQYNHQQGQQQQGQGGGVSGMKKVASLQSLRTRSSGLDVPAGPPSLAANSVAYSAQQSQQLDSSGAQSLRNTAGTEGTQPRRSSLVQYVSNALAKSSGVVRTSLAHLLEAGGSRQPGSHTHLDSLLATDAQVALTGSTEPNSHQRGSHQHRERVEAARKPGHLLPGLHIKIGIDTGRVLASVHVQTGRIHYRGKVMNRAARVAARCEPGQVLATLQAWQAAETREETVVFDGLCGDSLGEHELKGVPGLVALVHCWKSLDEAARRSKSDKLAGTDILALSTASQSMQPMQSAVPATITAQLTNRTAAALSSSLYSLSNNTSHTNNVIDGNYMVPAVLYDGPSMQAHPYAASPMQLHAPTYPPMRLGQSQSQAYLTDSPSLPTAGEYGGQVLPRPQPPVLADMALLSFTGSNAQRAVSCVPTLGQHLPYSGGSITGLTITPRTASLQVPRAPGQMPAQGFLLGATSDMAAGAAPAWTPLASAGSGAITPARSGGFTMLSRTHTQGLSRSGKLSAAKSESTQAGLERQYQTQGSSSMRSRRSIEGPNADLLRALDVGGTPLAHQSPNASVSRGARRPWTAGGAADGSGGAGWLEAASLPSRGSGDSDRKSRTSASGRRESWTGMQRSESNGRKLRFAL